MCGYWNSTVMKHGKWWISGRYNCMVEGTRHITSIVMVVTSPRSVMAHGCLVSGFTMATLTLGISCINNMMKTVCQYNREKYLATFLQSNTVGTSPLQHSYPVIKNDNTATHCGTRTCQLLMLSDQHRLCLPLDCVYPGRDHVIHSGKITSTIDVTCNLF